MHGTELTPEISANVNGNRATEGLDSYNGGERSLMQAVSRVLVLIEYSTSALWRPNEEFIFFVVATINPPRLKIKRMVNEKKGCDSDVLKRVASVRWSALFDSV